MGMTTFGEKQLKKGEGKARVCAVPVGGILECDDFSKTKWCVLARQNGMRFCRVPGGVKRLS